MTRTPAVSVQVCSITSIDATGNSWPAGLCRAYESDSDTEGTYYKKVGVAPGVPTEKGAYGDPENTGVGYNAVLTELGNHDVPQGWIQTPKPNTTPNTNPGPPVSWNARVTLTTHRLVMAIFQTTLQRKKPSSITVTTSAVRLTSQTTTPT